MKEPDPIISRQMAELRERQRDPMFDCVGFHVGRWTENIELNKADYESVIAYMDAFNANQNKTEDKDTDPFELYGIEEEQAEYIRLIRNIYNKYSNK